MRDKISIERIQELSPYRNVKDIFTSFIEDCEETLDITIRITEPVYRSIATQNDLFNHGRNGDKRPIVTNARGGQSYHNYGLAIDCCLINKDGSINYDCSSLLSFATKHGLEWGGSWTHIKDKPHFEKRFEFKEDCSDLLALYNSGKVDGFGYVII